MRKTITILATLILVATLAHAGSISAVSSYSAPNMVSEINVALQEGDVRMDALEGSMSTGTVQVVDLTVTAGDISAITDAGTATNVLMSNATIDGEFIGADTIDDDSIDFTDVTGADLTLTDCGSVVGTALSSGTGETTVDGKYAVTGGDASTGLMIQKAAGTPTAATTQTNAFAVAFGAAPTVVLQYTEAPGADTASYIVSTSTTNFVCEVIASKTYSFIAVGTRP